MLPLQLHIAALLPCVFVLLALSAPAAAAVVDLTPDNIDEYIPHPNKNVFVYFYASWCGHCTQFAPEFATADELFTSQSEEVIFAKADADTHKSIGARFGVNGFPTIKLYEKGGKDLNAHRPFVGARTSAGIFEFLTSELGIVAHSGLKATKKVKKSIDAVFENDMPLLLQLIKDGADIDEPKDGVSPLWWAAELGHIDIVKVLAKEGSDYNWDAACLAGDIQQIEKLIGQGQDVNQKEPGYGTTGLMLAAEKDYPELIALLIKHGADIDATNKNGNTALIKAAEFGKMNAVRALVDAGASMSVRNKADKSAFDVADAEGKAEVKAYLLSKGHDVHHVQPVAAEAPAVDSDKHDLPPPPEAKQASAEL